MKKTCFALRPLLLAAALFAVVVSSLSQAVLSDDADATATYFVWDKDLIEPLPYYESFHTSIALAPTYPFTPYYSYQTIVGDPGESRLRFAYYDGSNWVRQYVDSSSEEFGIVGVYNTLAVVPTSPYTPHLVYAYVNNLTQEGEIRYATLNPSGEWLVEYVDEGSFSTLALAPSPPYTPHVVYAGTNTPLTYAYRQGATWHKQQIGEKSLASLALAPSPPYTPHIAYVDLVSSIGELQYVYRTAQGWAREKVDDVKKAYGGQSLSLALLPEPPYTPYISYYDEQNRRLKLAIRDDGWHWSVIDSNGDVGRSSQLALSSFAPYAPVIAYSRSNTGRPNDVLVAWYQDDTWQRTYIGVAQGGTAIDLSHADPYTVHLCYVDETRGRAYHVYQAVPKAVLFLPLVYKKQ